MSKRDDLINVEIKLAEHIETILKDYKGEACFIAGHMDDHWFFMLGEVQVRYISSLPENAELKEYEEENLNNLAKAYGVEKKRWIFSISIRRKR